jgi:hypothetical protein
MSLRAGIVGALLALSGCDTTYIDRRDPHTEPPSGSGGAGGSAHQGGMAGEAGSGNGPPGTPPSENIAPDGTCDGALAVDSQSPWHGAWAMGLCEVYGPGDTWGVIDASWVLADGTPLVGDELHVGHGILSAFGPAVAPKEGHAMLVLSSGTARVPGSPSYQGVEGWWKDDSEHHTPEGYPKESPSCPGVLTGPAYDSAGLEVRIKTPPSASSFSFNLNFYTYEFPMYTCSAYNDFFVSLLSPVPAGLADGNISFDAEGNTISVNAGFLEVCVPQVAGGKSFECSLGPGALAGTGYDGQPNGSAATGWLKTTAPIESPGEIITLRFAIWDSGDGVLDSTVLLDGFEFDNEDHDAPWTVPDL